ncbi:MAG TPA: NIL domain-containing protein [Capsulimonadaceae bacterium]|nr:NIL domain-containing protein [Capsulimonadaceae bacterium]
METRKVKLDYPLERVQEPVVSYLVKKFDVAPNVLAANIDAHKGGWLVLELQGEAAQIDAALSWVKSQGITVQPVP